MALPITKTTHCTPPSLPLNIFFVPQPKHKRARPSRQNREHELFQTVIRRADPEKDAANSYTQQGLDLDNEPALRVDDHGRNCDTLAVGQQSWGEEERLLRAVDDGDLDL